MRPLSGVTRSVYLLQRKWGTDAKKQGKPGPCNIAHTSIGSCGSMEGLAYKHMRMAYPNNILQLLISSRHPADRELDGSMQTMQVAVVSVSVHVATAMCSDGGCWKRNEATAYQEIHKAGIRGRYYSLLKMPAPARGHLVSAFWYADIQMNINTPLLQCHFRYDGTIDT